VFPILKANINTYSATHFEPSSGEINKVSDVQGEQLAVVSGYQSRSNHRAALSGSMSICSDEMILIMADNQGVEASSNYKFC
jgi:hypothetical protein